MQPGSRLGPYEILSRIGAGGMGEVWRARDTRLAREVAIKILPEEFASDAKLKIRFEREARAIAHLTHPNICTLFDVGENYLVMELLEGESLAERLTRGPLTLSEVLRYGVQLAEALGQAHRQGVVHRDVKPGNVMITKAGAKLLDFGLAKSTRIEVASRDETVQKPITEQGAILGTFQYMAPEQLAGEEPDARTDIFALGVVLYEMATGKRAFEGKTRTSLVSAIMSGEPPPMRELQPLTPPALEHLILKCMDKDRDDRWQSASDVAEELRWISQAGSQAGIAPFVIKRRRWREWLTWTAICGSIVIIAALVWLLWRRAPVEQPPIESSIDMSATGGVEWWSGPPAFSPDGKTLAISADDKNGRRVLWVRPVSSAVPRPLPNTEGATSPFWSPDGKFIAFLAAGKLKAIPADGGDTDVIADAALGASGTWNRDGVILYFGGIRAGSSLLRVSRGGGDPAPVLNPASVGATHLSWPWFLPDGHHFLVYATGGLGLPKRQQDGIWVASIDGKERPRFLTAADSHAIYVEPGWLLFARDGVLRAQPFDPKTLRLSGESSTIAPVQSYFWNGSAGFSASNSGLLAYLSPHAKLSELQLRSRSGDLLRTLGRGYFWGPRLSHDGRRVAVDLSGPTSAGDIWILGVQNGSQSRLTFETINETSPIWSPDDQIVAYLGGGGPGGGGVLAKRAGGVAETLLDLPGGAETPTDWSSDGRYIAVYRSASTSSGDVLVFSLETGKTIELAATPAEESAAGFSPDSRWIAYQSDESGRNEVYVQPFPPTGAKYQVSIAGGHGPRWRVAGEIVYVGEDGHLTTARVETTHGFSVDPPQTLPLVADDWGHPSWTNFDVSADGNVLVNAIIRDNPQPLNLVVNWYQRLK